MEEDGIRKRAGNHSKVTFHNRYGITLAADLYIPKNANGKLPPYIVWAYCAATGCNASHIRNGNPTKVKKAAISLLSPSDPAL